jgi:chromosome partitioning protein
MADIRIDGSERVTLSDIRSLSERAKVVSDRIREGMLAPSQVKIAPTFSSAQLAALLDLAPHQIDYWLKKGGLPGGTNATGTRRLFTLSDVRTWARRFRADRMRPQDAEGIVMSIANYKGGVAKTTTAFTLAQGLAARGHKVLFIDVDPQGSATSLFGLRPDDIKPHNTLLPLCVGEESSIEYAISPTYWDGIDLVPAAGFLFGAEFALPGRQRSEGAGFKFWNVFHYGLEIARQNYDAIIMDTSPALSYLTINSILASDGIIMPLPPNGLDFASSVQFWDLFVDLTEEFETRGLEKSFDFVNILLSKVDTTDIATNVVREWISAAYGSRVLPIEIPKTSTAASSSAAFGSIYDMRPGSASSRTIKRAIDAYDQFVTTIESQMVSAWRRQMSMSSVTTLNSEAA